MPTCRARRQHLVVSGAKSRSHLVYIAAYLQNELAAHPSEFMKVSFVQAEAFLSAPAVQLKDLQAMIPADDRLEFVSGMPRSRFDEDAEAVYVSVGAPGLGMLVRLIRANPGRRFAVVVTDEGIGTYGSVTTRRLALRRQGVAPVTAAVKAAVISGVARVATTTRWAAYERKGGHWQVAPPIAREFRRYTQETVPGSCLRAVILTQPFADLGLLSEEAHLAYVDAMCAAAREVGLEPVIRPHPAEDTSKYGSRPLMAHRGTAELDPQVVCAALVLGGPSTALVNVSAMYGMNVLWVSIPGLEKLDTAVSRQQKEIFHTFLGAPVALPDVGHAVATALRGEPKAHHDS